MIRIKSITDVITNSSSSVYCIKMDEEFDELKKFMDDAGELSPDTFIELKTLEDVKKLIFSGEYEGWFDYTNGPSPKDDVFGGSRDTVMKLLAKGLTRDEIWEKLKHNYEPVLGYAFAEFFHEGYNSSDYDCFLEFYDMKVEQERNKFFENLVPGKFYACMIIPGKSFSSHYTEPFIMSFTGGTHFDYIYNPGWENQIELDKNGYLYLSFDLTTLREATPEEIEIAKKKYDENSKRN